MDKPSMGLIEFAARFVEKARNNAHEVPGVRKTLFTSRQSKAIGSLGIAKIMRTRQELGVNDLVHLAVITTPPEAQKYAEMIAIRVLMGEEEGSLEAEMASSTKLEEEEENFAPQLKGYQILLQDILDFLELTSSVDHKKGLKELQFAEDVENELFGKKEQDEEETVEQRLDYIKKRLSYEFAGGRQGIIQNKITNWKNLFSQAKKEIMKAVPNIDYQTIVEAELLGLNKDVKKLSREQYVKKLTELLNQAKQPELNDQLLEDQISELTTREVSKTLQSLNYFQNIIEQYGINKEEYAPSLTKMLEQFEDYLFENAKTLDDVLYQPSVFEDKLDRARMAEMIDNTWEYSSPLEMLHKAKEIDDVLGTNFSSQIMAKHKETLSQTSLEELLNQPISSPEWYNLFKEKLAEELEQFSEYEDYIDTLSKIERVKEQFNNPLIQDNLTKNEEMLLDQAIDSATTAEQLSEIVDTARRLDVKFNAQKIKQQGEKIGLTPREIAKILGSSFEYMKTAIESEEISFEETHVLLKHSNLSKKQIAALARVAVSHNREGALGALAIQDLEAVAKTIPDTKEGKELLRKALGAGGGENLLYQWFYHGNKLPKFLRQIVKDAAKRIFIDLAKIYASSLIGSSEAGPLPEGSTRPYQIGDDPDTIDIDETLEHILELGKRAEDVEVDDFIVRKTVTGRRCVVFLVDVSGSMEGKPLASASLATAMLLFAFSRDELGIALFESDTHVVCSIDEDIDLDEVVDEILDLEAMGGTQMERALSWGKEQFMLSRSQDKMLIMVTDAMIGDFYRCEDHLRDIADQGVTSVLVMPKSAVGLGNKQSIIENANAQLITVDDWKHFPEIVSKILSRT